MRPVSILIMTLQLSEKLDVYRMGLGSLRRYMDRITTDLFEKVTQVMTEAVTTAQQSSPALDLSVSIEIATEESLSNVRAINTSNAVEKFGKFFQHSSETTPAQPAFEEIDCLRGHVNQLEVLHAKLQYMMVELETLAKRA
jgi:hypothetical protein